MNTINVQVILFKSWSDSFGTRMEATRPGILVSIEGEVKLIPILSNGRDTFIKTNSLYECNRNRFGLDKESFLSFGYEVKYDKHQKVEVLRKKVKLCLDTLLEKRTNYHANGGNVLGSPYFR